jgi:hypothetical protein
LRESARASSEKSMACRVGEKCAENKCNFGPILRRGARARRGVDAKSTQVKSRWTPPSSPPLAFQLIWLPEHMCTSSSFQLHAIRIFGRSGVPV